MVAKRYATVYQDKGLALTGDERFPLLGTAITEEESIKVQTALRGLNPYWNCLEKAIKAQEILGRGIIMLGKAYVRSAAGSYGYEFNLPYEFHAWLVVSKTEAVDFALPGMIQKGSSLRDEQGPFLVGRDPVVLAGTVPDWILYEARELF